MEYSATLLTQGAAYLKADLIRSTPTAKEVKWLESCIENAQRFSTCSKAQYFSVILDDNGFLVSQGWNGTPPNTIHCKDGGCQRPIDASASGSTYDNCAAAHAEQGAIIRADVSKIWKKDATLIVNGTPCMDCARLILHSGIKRVVCIKDDRYDFLKIKDFLNLFDICVVAVNLSNKCFYCNGEIKHDSDLACLGCIRLMDLIHQDLDEASIDSLCYLGTSNVANSEIRCGICRARIVLSKSAKIDRRNDGTIRGIIHNRCRGMLGEYLYDPERLLKAAATARLTIMEDKNASK